MKQVDYVLNTVDLCFHIFYYGLPCFCVAEQHARGAEIVLVIYTVPAGFTWKIMENTNNVVLKRQLETTQGSGQAS